ncbi:hypothetical protein [Streptomyces sp. 1114.5]|uniref:hypothetical protein n=1 Tax=Streptomyces sp. 1114.5 TaxID=1938830 RepID=UPI0016017253|nr:hypothetical protein [Streptomyces sp. 1114.5]
MEGQPASPRRGSLRHPDSLLEHHLYPAFRSRRMGTFDHKVVEAFIRTMERNGVGLATQSNAFDKLKAILLDAHRLGLYDENPFDGVKPPQYDPKRAVIPSQAELQAIRAAGDDTFRLVVDLMSGCGLRNGEAFAVNLTNIVADDVYRVTEQVNQTTKDHSPLKHRKVGEYRDVPCEHRCEQLLLPPRPIPVLGVRRGHRPAQCRQPVGRGQALVGEPE